jgi:ribonuclease VapC
MTEVVLDTSAVLAAVFGEAGADRVSAVAENSHLSTVNLVEVVQKLVDRGFGDEVIEATLNDLPCRIEPLDARTGVRAGRLRRVTRSAGLSLGDRVCLVLAERLGLPVLTADRAWAGLDLGVEVVLIR